MRNKIVGAGVVGQSTGAGHCDNHNVIVEESPRECA